MGYLGEKSPLTLKVSEKISDSLDKFDLSEFLETFILLDDKDFKVKITLNLMAKYNLLSNDALIITLCKLHNIKNLASYDPDFIEVCQKEGINLIQKVEDLDEI